MRVKFMILILLLSASANADEIVRPHSHSDHSKGLRFEYAQKIKGVKVAWANYKAIKRDFPEIKSLTNKEIDRWLEVNLPYIGSQQSRLNGKRNTPIPLDGKEEKEAFRPAGWIRSAQLEVWDHNHKTKIGLMDIKGFGYGDHSVVKVDEQVSAFNNVYDRPDQLNNLRVSDHSDGLMSFGEAIAETTRQMAIQMLFELRELPFETVETYAVLRLPFNILKENSQEVPAAFYVRQANSGRAIDMPAPKEIYIDEFGHKQKTDNHTAVDFGGAFITDPLLKDTYGNNETDNPQQSKPWRWAHEVALAFDRGDTNAVFRHLQEMLSPIDEMYKNSQAVKDRLRKNEVLRRYIRQLRKLGVNYRSLKQKVNEQLQKTKAQTRERKIKMTPLHHIQISLTSSAPHIVSQAIRSLHTYDFETIEPMISNPRLLKNDVQSRAIIDLLAKIPDKRALSLLQSIHQKNNGAIRIQVLEALKNRVDETVLNLIEDSLKNGFNTEREAAIAALEGWPEEMTFPIIKKYIQAYPKSTNAILMLGKSNSEKSLDILINDYYQKDIMPEYILEVLKYRSDKKSLDFLFDSLSKTIYKKTLLTTLASRIDLPAEERKNFAKDGRINSETRYLFYKNSVQMSCENVFRN